MGEVQRRSAVRISLSAFTLSRLLPGGGAAGSVFAARELVAAATRCRPRSSPWPSPGGYRDGAGGNWWSPALHRQLSRGTIPRPHSASCLCGRGRGSRPAPPKRSGSRAAGRLATQMAARIGTAGPRWRTIEAAHHPGRRRLLGVAGWALAAWVCDAAALAVSFVALGHPLDIGVLLVGYGLVNLLSALPELTPGWLGVLEATWRDSCSLRGLGGSHCRRVLGYRLVLLLAAGRRRNPRRSRHAPLTPHSHAASLSAPVPCPEHRGVRAAAGRGAAVIGLSGPYGESAWRSSPPRTTRMVTSGSEAPISASAASAGVDVTLTLRGHVIGASSLG